MVIYLKNWYEKKIDEITVPVDNAEEKVSIKLTVSENFKYIKSKLDPSFDVKYRTSEIGKIKFGFVMLDGMCNNELLTEQIMIPVLRYNYDSSDGEKVILTAADRISGSIDKSIQYELNTAIREMLSGNLLMFVDGSARAVLFGVQGFPKRNISEPDSETQERGSKEGFSESFKDNVALVRKRIRSPILKTEVLEVGTTSKTRVCVLYLSDRANEKTVKEVKQKIQNSTLDICLGSGYIQPFLEGKVRSCFSGVGVTERPDVLTAKLSEGKVGIITDGTPDALFLPYIFTEHFHSLDDYLKKPYYATSIRLLKIAAFLISVFLPGLYVAICTFHQEVIPETMIFDICLQESFVPLPIMAEALMMHVVFEIVREAGLRMPRSVGNAVSIVGALVIGDAAVNAGLVAAPMLIILGLTAVSSFVIPSLYDVSSVLRFILIIIGGLAGFYGIMIAFAAVLVNMSAIEPFGVPFTSPLSPTKLGAWRDLIIRTDWKKLGANRLNTDRLDK